MTRRSIRSAMAPDTTPRKKKAAIRAEIAAPTIREDSVISSTSQPRATESMPIPTDCASVDAQSSLKSRYRNETAQM